MLPLFRCVLIVCIVLIASRAQEQAPLNELGRKFKYLRATLAFDSSTPLYQNAQSEALGAIGGAMEGVVGRAGAVGGAVVGVVGAVGGAVVGGAGEIGGAVGKVEAPLEGTPTSAIGGDYMGGGMGSGMNCIPFSDKIQSYGRLVHEPHHLSLCDKILKFRSLFMNFFYTSIDFFNGLQTVTVTNFAWHLDNAESLHGFHVFVPANVATYSGSWSLWGSNAPPSSGKTYPDPDPALWVQVTSHCGSTPLDDKSHRTF